MNHDAKSLLELDRLEEVLQAPDRPQPVVVIQYPKHRMPWYRVVSLIAIMVIGIGGIYHRLEVEHFRSKAVAAQRELESWKERMRLQSEREELVPSRPSTPLSTTSQPVGKDPSRLQAPATSKPAAPKESPTSTSAAVTAGKDRSSSVPGAVVRESGATPPESPLAVRSPERPVESPPTVIATAPRPQDPPSPFETMRRESVKPAGRSPEAAASQSPAVARSPTPAAIPDASGRSLAEGPKGSPAAPVDPPITTVAVSADPPLPSKEETLRMIEEEGMQKQEEIRHQIEDKAVEIHRLRNQERLRFHDELRDALEQYGRRAGAAIDQLCVRYGYEADRNRLMRGSQIWTSGMRLTRRVAEIRKLELPETAILNFLSDDLHARVRTRDGPRDSNEVRVRAALLLLNQCELPSIEGASVPPAVDGGGPPTANRRVGNPSSKANAAARPR